MEMRTVTRKKDIIPAIEEYIKKNGPATAREMMMNIPHSRALKFEPGVLATRMVRSGLFKNRRMKWTENEAMPRIWELK